MHTLDGGNDGVLAALADGDDRDDRRDPDEYAEHGEERAQLVDAQGVEGGNQHFAGVHEVTSCSSATMRPSLMRTIRSAAAATSGSCVMTTMVTP